MCCFHIAVILTASLQIIILLNRLATLHGFMIYEGKMHGEEPGNRAREHLDTKILVCIKLRSQRYVNRPIATKRYAILIAMF